MAQLSIFDQNCRSPADHLGDCSEKAGIFFRFVRLLPSAVLNALPASARPSGRWASPMDERPNSVVDAIAFFAHLRREARPSETRLWVEFE